MSSIYSAPSPHPKVIQLANPVKRARRAFAARVEHAAQRPVSVYQTKVCRTVVNRQKWLFACIIHFLVRRKAALFYYLPYLSETDSPTLMKIGGNFDDNAKLLPIKVVIEIIQVKSIKITFKCRFNARYTHFFIAWKLDLETTFTLHKRITLGRHIGTVSHGISPPQSVPRETLDILANKIDSIK
jgi:hypothetical protein